MVRHLFMAAVLSAAASVAFVQAAPAQSYSGVRPSFGSGSYDRYEGNEYRGYRGYEQPRYDPYHQERRET